jgi:ABC-type multidrug transport system ATPase subunit
MNDAVEIAALTLRFGGTLLLSDVTLSVPRGTVVAVCGRPNTGKSALLASLTGHARPTSGQLRIAGVPVLEAVAAARQLLTYVDGPGPLVPHLTVRQNLSVIVQLSGGGRPAQATLDAALRQADLPDRRFRLSAVHLNAKECLCVWLAAAHLRRSPAVLLDEPAGSLSPRESSEVLTVIRELGVFAGVLVATRDRQFADDVADAVYVIEDGRLVAQPRLGATFVTNLDDLVGRSRET